MHTHTQKRTDPYYLSPPPKQAFDGRKSTVWEAESEMHNFFTGGNGEDFRKT